GGVRREEGGGWGRRRGVGGVARGPPGGRGVAGLPRGGRLMTYSPLAMVAVLLIAAASAGAADLGQSGFVDSGGVKLHFVAAGEGPLLVLLHGFPDYHYTWRDQMPALSKHFRVVALDLRGYNRSDKPEGVAHSKLDRLTDAVAAVLDHFKQRKVILVGHDWGGFIAWAFAATHPDRVDRLVILNLPHPNGLLRELANNPEQQKNSQYARD